MAQTTLARRGPALDRFRLAAAVLVVAIHTGPLASFAPGWDLWLTRGLARVAVPFFFMVTGYFLARGNWQGTGRAFRRLLALYLAAVVLYLPLNLYAGSLPGWRELLCTGTFYHLWYFPAVLLGLWVARGLAALGPRAGLALAGGLYLLGLGGDSWYGLTAALPPLRRFYDGLLALLGGYTRGGLFFAPLFLLLGAAFVRRPPRRGCAGLALAGLAGLTAECLALHALGWPRHDSMYLSLPPAMAGIFGLLLARNAGQDKPVRRVSMLLYLLHPWGIVAVRGLARLLGARALLVDNSLVHFAAVLAGSLAAAWVLTRLPPPGGPGPRARAWRELDLAALRHNARVLQAALPAGCRLMAVVKADAYGHGLRPAARCLQRAGVRGFAVATLAEGIALRRAGVRGTVLVLGWTDPAEAARLRAWRLTAAVAGPEHGRALAAAGQGVRVHLAVDTGMHRLGLPWDDPDALAELFALPGLRVTGVFSHLCVSDSPAPADRAFTREQARRFAAAVDALRARGLDPGAVHLQASYGIWNADTLAGAAPPCAWARAGIALYGVPSDAAPVDAPLDLRPALALRARVAAVRRLAAGEGAGYGLAFRAARPTTLAVVAIGYADGLPRDLAERGGGVLLQGRRCPMVGRLCMDQLLVDATDLPDPPCPGDTATLIGRDGTAQITAVQLAAACGTITNELLARLGPRLGLVPTGGRPPRKARRPGAG